MTSKEDDLKNLKADFLRNHWLDLIQILNLKSGDQKEKVKGLNWRRPQWKMTSKEDELKNSATTGWILSKF